MGAATMKRLFWTALGLGAGVVIGAGVMRWANETRESLRPRSLADNLVEAAASWRDRLADALEAGREAMAEREEALHARYEGFSADTARARNGADG
jgi:hypothetical protein